MKNRKTLLLVFPLCLSIISCGRVIGTDAENNSNLQAEASSSDNTQNTAISALVAVEQALDDTESTPSVQASCPSITACSANIRTLSFNSCSIGGTKFNGAFSWQYDSSSTCTIDSTTLPTSGSLLRTTDLFEMTTAEGFVTKYFSTNMSNYKNEIIGGGVTVSFGATSRTVNINGLHRQRYTPKSFKVFDHSLRSVVPFVVAGTKAAANRVVSNGSVNVFHNIARTNTTLQFNNVRWDDAGCCHPKLGTITATAENSNDTFELNFSEGGTCGIAKLKTTINNQVTTTLVSLGNCI